MIGCFPSSQQRAKADAGSEELDSLLNFVEQKEKEDIESIIAMEAEALPNH
jgi:hypothetical protein